MSYEEDFEGTDWENCHRVLGRTLRALDEAHRPPPPYHLGGPQPRLRGYSSLRLALWMVPLFRPQLTRRVEGKFDRFVGLAHEVLEAEAYVPGLYKIAGMRNSSNDALAAARMTLMVAAQCQEKFQARAADSLVGIATRAARLADDPKAFLRDLDARICLEEARYEIGDRLPDDVEPVEVLFRGDRGNGTAGHFLLRLESGDYGLQTKLKHKYRWFRGDRDAMLATLPDDVFGEGVRVALR